VPNGKSEHAVESLEAIRPPSCVGPDDDFSVRRAAPLDAVIAKGLANFKEIVNFTVVHDDVAPVRGRHGLMTRAGEVDDGEALMSEANVAAGPDAGIVWSAETEGSGRLANHVAIHFCAKIDNAYNSAHFLSSLRLLIGLKFNSRQWWEAGSLD